MKEKEEISKEEEDSPHKIVGNEAENNINFFDK